MNYSVNFDANLQQISKEKQNMNIKNIIVSLVILIIVIASCNTYEDTVCTVCEEQNVLFTTKMCGDEANVANFERNLTMGGDSVQFYDTVRKGDKIIKTLDVEETTVISYWDTLIWDSIGIVRDSLAYGKDTTFRSWIYNSGGTIESYYEDSIEIKYRTYNDYEDTILFVYTDSVRIDSQYIYEIVIYNVNRYNYAEPYISANGDTTYSLLDYSSLNYTVDSIRSTIDSLDLDEHLQYDTATYKTYFQQEWKCIRQ